MMRTWKKEEERHPEGRDCPIAEGVVWTERRLKGKSLCILDRRMSFPLVFKQRTQ